MNTFIACIQRLTAIFEPKGEGIHSFIESLIGLVSLERYQEIRREVALALDVPAPEAFSGVFDEDDTEAGDLSDAWQEITKEMFPRESVSVTAQVSLATRKKWCENIIATFDRIADLDAQDNDAPWPEIDMTDVVMPGKGQEH